LLKRVGDVTGRYFYRVLCKNKTAANFEPRLLLNWGARTCGPQPFGGGFLIGREKRRIN